VAWRSRARLLDRVIDGSTPSFGAKQFQRERGTGERSEAREERSESRWGRGGDEPPRRITVGVGIRRDNERRGFRIRRGTSLAGE
jgi:hypothetical protein